MKKVLAIFLQMFLLIKCLADWTLLALPCAFLLRPCLVRKNFQDYPSHRIFGRMHGALNIDKNKN